MNKRSIFFPYMCLGYHTAHRMSRSVIAPFLSSVLIYSNIVTVLELFFLSQWRFVEETTNLLILVIVMKYSPTIMVFVPFFVASGQIYWQNVGSCEFGHFLDVSNIKNISSSFAGDPFSMNHSNPSLNPPRLLVEHPTMPAEFKLTRYNLIPWP